MSDTLSRAKKLFDLGAHLGHRKNRLHPRARKYVFQIVDGVSIIDLEKTIGQIDTAKAFLKQAGAEDKSLLFCATKKNIAAHTMKLAGEVGAHFITTKWLPGLFTNFDTIAKNVKKLRTLRDQKLAGEWGKYQQIPGTYQYLKSFFVFNNPVSEILWRVKAFCVVHVA
jgi:small subunit ribosomal protein S2